MQCDRVKPLLNACADGELGRVTRWRVDRHLERCPACAAELSAIHRIGAAARAWRDVTAPEEFRMRIASSLAGPDLAVSPSRRLAVSPRRRRRLGFALATVAAAALLVVAVGRRVDPAYALLRQSEAAYRQLKSAHLAVWLIDPTGRRIEIEGWYAHPYRSWSRRGDEVEVIDGTYEWTYREGAKSVRRRPIGKLEPEAWQRLFDLDRHIERVRRGVGVEDLGTEVREGAPLRKLRLLSTAPDERQTWWIDPKSGLMRKMVMERANEAAKNEWRVVGESTRIEYDVPPPEGLFTFTPPKGVTVVTDTGGAMGWLPQQLGVTEPIATKQTERGPVQLLAFTRSKSGDLFVVIRSPKNWARGYPLELTDSVGGRYVGRGFDMGSGDQTTWTALFFARSPRPVGGRLKYQVRLHRMASAEDPSPPDELQSPIATFADLKPTDGPALLDTLVRDYADRDMNVSYDFLRASGIGLTAYREGKMEEAMPHLEAAARNASNPNRDDTGKVYLALADLYSRAGRRDDARDLLDRAWKSAHADLPQLGRALRTVEAMDRLGERETAKGWARSMLRKRDYMQAPYSIFRAMKLYERLTGDAKGARDAAVEPLKRYLRESSSLGSLDGEQMGQFFEQIGERDLALQAYVKGLETSDLLKHYRNSGGTQFREDTEKLIAAVRRLGGEEAVRRLTPKPLPEGE